MPGQPEHSMGSTWFGCLGTPDMIVEIVSAKRSIRDLKDKFDIYQEHGVREYWIINPADENVTAFVLIDKGKFQFVGMYAEDDKIPVNIQFQKIIPVKH